MRVLKAKYLLNVLFIFKNKNLTKWSRNAEYFNCECWLYKRIHYFFFLIYGNNLHILNSRDQVKFLSVEYLHVENYSRWPTLSCFFHYSKRASVSWEVFLSTSHGSRYLGFLTVWVLMCLMTGLSLVTVDTI